MLIAIPHVDIDIGWNFSIIGSVIDTNLNMPVQIKR